MRRLAIEINDAALVVADDEGVIWSEPGFAVVDRKKILTGNEAFALARLKPRETSARFWSELSIEPGSAGLQGKMSTAELAHAQFEALWREVGQGVDQVILVAPGMLEGDALGIVLGLAEECGMPVGAIVNAAVAASVRPWPGRQLVHVDAGLFRVIVTPLDQGERVTARPPALLESMGLAGLIDAFARRVAELFVLGTRFDPFHHAETEQQLYDRMTALLMQLDSGESAQISIEHDGETFEIEVQRQQLLGAAQGFYRAVRQRIAQSRSAHQPLVVQLSGRLASLPGLEDELARLDATTVVELEPGFAARSVLSVADKLGLADEGVKLFRHLPWREDPADEPAPVAAPAPVAVVDEPQPTHVVYQGIAYAVNGDGLVVGRSRLDQRKAILIESRAEGVSRAHCELSVIDGELRLRDLSSFGTFVNERRIEGEEVLKPADVIRVGSPGAELTVVRLEEADGA